MIKKKKISVAKKKNAPKARAKSKKALAAPRVQKPAGYVTHFFGGIKVAIIKCKTPFSRGVKIRFKGATTDFAETVISMQYDHKDVARAKKGQQIGVKVKKRVREGDIVYLES